ncbi:MAG: tRNA dihydrouridine synthase DusB [Bacteroidales bacterium]|jgi:tRNA-dihydrouridine synthase B|nr:tRNA dihydrouridine synthase DusB [Bacteroidales bacterium]MDD3151992.1 tRNA dihydrouridine synthase DusB [Bacteroidales bacterium]MDD3913886.1 tRNA dihydrouridine synthase DusB [Bacteroidales bacterium]MDD4634658.1 tRNA dihydrouridine synthase DusB [Bacteroidales bacterium]
MKIADIELPEKPLILAPMEGITEMPFRIICKRFGADLMFSEFVASEGLIRDAEKSIKKLNFQDKERPIGIQIFGHDINSLVSAAKIALETNPDLIDLNCGCPVKKVVNKGAGAALMLEPEKMAKAVSEIVKISDKPVTVKTRIGWDFNSINIEDIAWRLQDAGAAAITVHGRTRSQMYTGEADWSVIAKVKNNPNIHIPIFGNGDITSGEVAKQKLQLSNVDGLMIGRAAVGNPWIFKEVKAYLANSQSDFTPSLSERVEICKEHVAMSVDYKGENRSLLEMRQHYAKYFKGVYNFKMYKMRLMQAQTIAELMEILDEVGEAFNV